MNLPYVLEPWKHQRDIIEKAGDTYAIFGEMGTGKTGIGINLIRKNSLVHNRLLRTIIFCPPSVKINWKREFAMHSKIKEELVHVSEGCGKKRIDALDEAISTKKVIIINYEALLTQAVYAKLVGFKPEMIIYDESHLIKSYKAARTKKCWELSKFARYRYIMTGTAILNSPMDIFAQYKAMDLGRTFGDNFWAFRSEFFEDKNAGMPKHKYFPDWRPREKTYGILNQRIFKKATRVLKKDCMDLPPLIKKQVTVEMSKEQQKAYDDMKKHLIAYLNDKACVANMALTKSLRLQQIVSGHIKFDDETTKPFEKVPRITALTETLVDILEESPTNKVIVWACFRENVRQIAQELDKLEIPHTLVVGGLTDKQRQGAIDEFQKDPKIRIIVANQAAGGIGINLTKANFSIYYSKNWNLSADLQSEARNHRGGSEIHDTITRIDLVTPDSIDEIINEALAGKLKIAETILQIKERI